MTVVSRHPPPSEIGYRGCSRSGRVSHAHCQKQIDCNFMRETGPLAALHARLESMHRTYEVDLSSFQENYTSNVVEASSLVEHAFFDGYALKRGGAPSALHFAAGCGCLEICVLLLNRCSRLNFTTDSSGQTPLFWAVKSGLRSTVALLLQHEADAIFMDGQGNMPLHVVASAGFPQTCGLLLACPSVQSSGIDHRSRRGWTPLHVAASHGHAEIVDRLLGSAADPMAVTPQDRTALHLAAMSGHSMTLERLLEVSPRELCELCDIEGMRAVDYAIERGLPGPYEVLAAEEIQQEQFKLNWKSFFEPPCRSRLNVSMNNAWLEIGKPEVRIADRNCLQLGCRVTDALGLLEAYIVEVSRPQISQSFEAGGIAVVNFDRSLKQRPIDDVEFRIPRRSGDQRIWLHGSVCAFRVIGVVSTSRAAGVGYPCETLRSVWTGPIHLSC